MAINWIEVDDLEDADNPDAPFAIEYASFILYKLTGEKYPGTQETTEWYGFRRDESWCSAMESSLIEYGITPHFIGRSSKRRKTISLRRRPVIDILSVRDYDSDRELSDGEYDLRNHAFLNKKNGFWELDCGGYLVNYLYGMNPPEAGKRAAVILATEIMKSITDPDNCALPSRVTSVSRQGTSYTILDPQEYIEGGRTGLYEVDLFLTAANPAKAMKRPRVVVPGVPQGETFR